MFCVSSCGSITIRMWANAQRDGRPAKYNEWPALFHTAAITMELDRVVEMSCIVFDLQHPVTAATYNADGSAGRLDTVVGKQCMDKEHVSRLRAQHHNRTTVSQSLMTAMVTSTCVYHYCTFYQQRHQRLRTSYVLAATSSSVTLSNHHQLKHQLTPSPNTDQRYYCYH